ncbi:MAG: TIGR03960 family B12-binding radical SAM protein [Pseudomonadota bacterium]
MKTDKLNRILPKVSKPYRYIGGEVGERKKNWDDSKVKFCLIYPDIYELGTSHLGLSILYNIVNDEDWMLAERAFVPGLDMASHLKEEGIPLFSLESQKPLRDFDVIGITLPYELTFTNILTILDLAHIPRRSIQRGDSDPVVIGGGSSVFNPEPVADFFDAIVIGDGEDVVLKIGEVVRNNKGKRDAILSGLSDITGVYVPNHFSKKQIKRAHIENLDNAKYPLSPIVPYRSTHERAIVEVARGCKRGCRFCQAGFIYRPWRERSSKDAVRLAIAQLENSGCDVLSFLSLSLSDWGGLSAALQAVDARQSELPFNISMPSLRVEALNDEILKRLGKDRSSSFTLAPEAASELLRRMMNKGNNDEELLASVKKIFELGWHHIKLYFMLGLPGETDEEIFAISALAKRCLSIGREYIRHPNITVSTSTFVHKSHTPFQWAPQISIDETRRKQAILKRDLRGPGLKYKWHNPEMSLLEGIFSRGGRELSKLIERACDLGCRFDAWDEHFRFDLWRQAFEEMKIDVDDYLKECDKDFKFPWDHIFVDLKKEYLWSEWERAKESKLTPMCEIGRCKKCGICK